MYDKYLVTGATGFLGRAVVLPGKPWNRENLTIGV